MRLIRNLFILESYRDNHNRLHVGSAAIIAVQEKELQWIADSYLNKLSRLQKEDVQQ
jgi:hypothetical protein